VAISFNEAIPDCRGRSGGERRKRVAVVSRPPSRTWPWRPSSRSQPRPLAWTMTTTTGHDHELASQKTRPRGRAQRVPITATTICEPRSSMSWPMPPCRFWSSSGCCWRVRFGWIWMDPLAGLIGALVIAKLVGRAATRYRRHPARSDTRPTHGGEGPRHHRERRRPGDRPASLAARPRGISAPIVSVATQPRDMKPAHYRQRLAGLADLSHVNRGSSASLAQRDLPRAGASPCRREGVPRGPSPRLRGNGRSSVPWINSPGRSDG